MDQPERDVAQRPEVALAMAPAGEVPEGLAERVPAGQPEVVLDAHRLRHDRRQKIGSFRRAEAVHRTFANVGSIRLKKIVATTTMTREATSSSPSDVQSGVVGGSDPPFVVSVP